MQASGGKLWAIRLLLTTLVAAIMAFVGYELMGLSPSKASPLLFILVPSVPLWLALAFVLYRSNSLATAILCGIFSPFLGSLWFGPGGVLMACVYAYITLPVGIVTGVLVRGCVSIGRQPPPAPSR